MTSPQIEFVETHFDQIEQIKSLAEQYRQFVSSDLKKQLEAAVDGCSFQVYEGNWRRNDCDPVFYCDSPQWGKNQLVLYKEAGPSGGFFVRAYICDASREQILKRLPRGRVQQEGKFHHWTSSSAYTSRDAAVPELCKLAKSVHALLR